MNLGFGEFFRKFTEKINQLTKFFDPNVELSFSSAYVV